MGFHGNHAFSYSLNKFIFDGNFSAYRGPNEQFGTREKLSWVREAGYVKVSADV